MTVDVHYDGAVLVPDAPVDLPVGQPLQADIRPLERKVPYSELSVAERLRRLELAAGRIKDVTISGRMSRQDNFYEEREPEVGG